MANGNRLTHHGNVIPVITSLFVEHPYLIATIGFGMGYYLHATLGFQPFLELMPYDIGVVAIAGLSLQPAVDSFYADIKEQYRDTFAPRSFQIPNRSIFFPTMTSDVGVWRKAAGYVYAVAQTSFSFACGVMLSLGLGRGSLPVFW